MEIIFAIALASVAVISLIVIFSFVFSSARTGKTTSKATSIAQRYLERMKADRRFFERVKTSPQFSEREIVWEGAATAPVEYTVRVSLNPTGTDQRYVDGLVTVSWTERSQPKHIALETFFPSW